jgi:predicted DNA-binding transcriptional regulator AlpA
MSNPETTIDYFVRLPEARRLLGNFSPSQFDTLIRQGKLPRPMKLVPGGRAAGYPISVLREFIENRKAEAKAEAEW